MKNGRSKEVGIGVLSKNIIVQTPEVMFGSVLFGPGSSIGPRIQRKYQLGMVLSGGCDVMANVICSGLTPVMTILLSPGTREHVTFAGECETRYAWCCMSPKNIPPGIRKRLIMTCSSKPCSEAFVQIFATALSIQESRDGEHNDLINHQAISLFLEYISMWTSDDDVLKAKRYIEQHYGEGDCLQGAVNASGLTRNAITYKFRSTLGTTPDRYLWHLRTEKGVVLLAETGLAIPDIANRCGFKTAAHFMHLVTSLKGIPPATLRKSAWSGKGA